MIDCAYSLRAPGGTTVNAVDCPEPTSEQRDQVARNRVWVDFNTCSRREDEAGRLSRRPSLATNASKADVEQLPGLVGRGTGRASRLWWTPRFPDARLSIIIVPVRGNPGRCVRWSSRFRHASLGWRKVRATVVPQHGLVTDGSGIDGLRLHGIDIAKWTNVIQASP
jgi:hypothetical protein